MSNHITALVNTSGSVQERFSYVPYGANTVLNAALTVKGGGTGYAWEHRYTGRRLDPGSGLQLNRNRYYRQQLGRWCGRDPIGYEGGASLYQAYFIPGDMDPSGKIKISCECNWAGIEDGGTFNTSINCLGLASDCCKKACDKSCTWGASCKPTGSWKIVPGPDAYDDARCDYNEAVAEICLSVALFCSPVDETVIIVKACGSVTRWVRTGIRCRRWCRGPDIPWKDGLPTPEQQAYKDFCDEWRGIVRPGKPPEPQDYFPNKPKPDNPFDDGYDGWMDPDDIYPGSW